MTDQEREAQALNRWRARGVEILEEPPDGWTLDAGANNHPSGFHWYTNGASMFSSDYRHALIRDRRR